ncbi:MAG: DUF2786 domain-containing protein [Spirochaetaceae bacterium]|jgi:hypothetical protein|nr:DUF2786 domain-containing protein [Spirochaetaceae bacterium]
MISENMRQKILKLFSMAEGGYGNEAEIALKKAYKFMQEYGVTRDDIELATAETPEKRRIPRWIQTLHSLCATFCGVVPLIGYKCSYFMGDEIGVNVALELYLYLKNEIARKASQSPIRGLRAKNEYRMGIVFGIYERLKANIGWRDMAKRQELIAAKHFSKTKVKHLSAYVVLSADYIEAGKEKANEINISRQVGCFDISGFLEEA